MDAFRTMKWTLVCALLVLGLAGCSFPTELFFEPPPVGSNPGQSTSLPLTPTFTVVATDSPVPPTPIACAYAWTNKPLPDETAMVQDALKKAGLNTVEVTVMAYGENCLDILNNQVVKFSAMQTDFYFSIPVKDAGDASEMGGWAGKILPVLRGFPPGKVPGPNLGYCQLHFLDGTTSSMLWFKIDFAQKALQNGLSGAVLFKALNAP